MFNFISYRLLLILLSPLLLAHISWLATKNRQSLYFFQRLGFKNTYLPGNGFWFHCASVGEVVTLLPLVKAFHKKHPDIDIIITTNTITGRKIVIQQNLSWLHHCYLPFDWSFSITRFLNVIRPRALFIMETEIWPNLFAICHRRNIPASIINARLSDKTLKANSWVRNLLGYALQKIQHIYSRTVDDEYAYQSLGVNHDIAVHTGNLKFAAITDNAPPANRRINGDYILLASSHEGEDQPVFDCWLEQSRNELLVIAPRHPERGNSILNLVTSRLDRSQVALRSKEEAITEITRVFILDTVGELKQYFANAKLVIMGGSFIPVGGHNILEPASYHCPVITGPHMHNFRLELELMQSLNAIIQIHHNRDLTEACRTLLDDDEKRKMIAENTRQLSVNANEVLQRYTDILSGYL